MDACLWKCIVKVRHDSNTHCMMQVKATEERSSSGETQLEEVREKVTEWQNKYNEKNAEAEEQAARHFGVSVCKYLEIYF